MENQTFKLSILAYIAVIISWLFSILTVAFFVFNSPSLLIFERNWAFLILFFGALLSPSFLVTWSLIVELTTSFSADGINRLTVLGRRLIYWHQIVSLKTRIFFVDVTTSEGIIHIPLLMYVDPNGLADYIHKQFNSNFGKT